MIDSTAPLSDAAARALASTEPGDFQERSALDGLMAAARERRERYWAQSPGDHPSRCITFSPKVFLPLTNLCRNFCDYCSFRRSPGQAGEWTMSPDEVLTWLDRARDQGCVEALLCLGDQPESAFPSYRATLARWGHDSTVDYLHWAGERALERGLLPHTNAGVLSKDEMARLAPVNVSLGLMLENVSPRLCQKGMPHHRAPDKRPERRLAMTREAGELAIAFTSGLLIGIGETRLERIETLLAIRDEHRRHGHIQEVIVQNFRANPESRLPGKAHRIARPEAPVVAMRAAPEPGDRDIAWTVAVARLILDDDVSVQAPPNLNPAGVALLLDAGVNDLGGISPVTPDYINPTHPWPHLDGLAEILSARAYQLRPRTPVYDRYLEKDDFLDDRLRRATRAVQARLDELANPAELAGRRGRPESQPVMPTAPGGARRDLETQV